MENAINWFAVASNGTSGNDDSNCARYYNLSENLSNEDVPSGTGYTTILSSSFSVIGSLLIIFTYVAYREVRTVGRAILVFLAVADLLTALGYIFGSAIFLHFRPDRNYYDQHNTSNVIVSNIYVPLCRFQSFITTVFPISSFLWTTNLAIYFFVTIVLRKVQAAKKLILIFHITAWGIPLVICIPAVATEWLGPANSHTTVSWCWVRFEADNPQELPEFYVMELICGKFWEIMAYFVSLMLCGIVKYTLYKRKHGYMTEAAAKYGYVNIETKMKAVFNHVDQKLIWIPIVFFMVRIWGTMRYFISLLPACRYICYDDGAPDIVTLPSCSSVLYNHFLLYAQSIGDPGQGWSNALLFVVFHRPITERLFPCCVVCWDRFFYWLGKVTDHLKICEIRQKPVANDSCPCSNSATCTPANSAATFSNNNDRNPLIIKDKSGSKTSYDSVVYYPSENDPNPQVKLPSSPKDNVSINELVDSRRDQHCLSTSMTIHVSCD